MAKLADAYGSGPYGGNFMQVQVLFPAPEESVLTEYEFLPEHSFYLLHLIPFELNTLKIVFLKASEEAFFYTVICMFIRFRLYARRNREI